MIIKICAIIIIAFVAQFLFNLAGYDLSIPLALLCGGFFVLLDAGLGKIHHAVIDRS
jgi:hypothetical protein